VPTIDEIAPKYVRGKRIDFKFYKPPAPPPPPEDWVAPPDYEPPPPPGPDVAEARVPFHLEVSYARTLPDYVMAPLRFEVQGPDGYYRRQDFTREPPTHIGLTLPDAGRYLVVLRELAHNLFWGSFVINVQAF
jgi:hypothetical protein